MLKLLSQIIATFIALGTTFFVSYYIYLFSSRNAVNEKIQQGGLKIVEILNNTPKCPAQLLLFDSFLLAGYQKEHPNDTKLQVLNHIGSDLSSFPYFHNDFPEHTSKLSSYLRGGYKGNFFGRLYFWLIDKSIEELIPDDVKLPIRSISFSPTYEGSTYNSNMFPFGPVGVEQWTMDFDRARNYLRFLSFAEEDFMNDYFDFIEENKNRLNISTDKEQIVSWLDKTKSNLDEIASINIHIQSLLRLRDTYSVKEIFPHLNWILLLGTLLMLLGVIFPLGILSFINEENIPPTVNIIFLIIALSLLAGTIALSFKDIIIEPNKKMSKDYLIPLKKHLETSQILNYIHDYEILNIVLSKKEEIKLPVKTFQLLESYRTALIENNKTSEYVVNYLSNKLIESDRLKKYYAKPNAGGITFNILSLILEQESYIRDKIAIKGNYIFQSMFGRVTTDHVKVRIPNNQEDLEIISKELCDIRTQALQDQAIRKYVNLRNDITDIQQQLLDLIN
jgi:hypothetical protein